MFRLDAASMVLLEKLNKLERSMAERDERDSTLEAQRFSSIHNVGKVSDPFGNTLYLSR
jgi:hypothetical protein